MLIFRLSPTIIGDVKAIRIGLNRFALTLPPDAQAGNRTQNIQGCKPSVLPTELSGAPLILQKEEM